MPKEKNETFQDSYKKLQEIMNEIEENEDMDVDELVEKIKSSAKHLKFCKKKLENARLQIDKVCSEMDELFVEE
ncbi:exodeoxyribonuclease VII small subunit [Candidatus Riflebacteria bacterium]